MKTIITRGENLTRLRVIGIARSGILREGESLIPGGHYTYEGELIKPEINYEDLYSRRFSSHKEYVAHKSAIERAAWEEFSRRIQDPGVIYKQGKKLLVLDYAYEPPGFDQLNISFHGNKTGVTYLSGVINRILGVDFGYSYIKITCNYPGRIDTEAINTILEEATPDYVWIIGFDLFNRLPVINGRGPDLATPNGFARTYTIWDESQSRSVLCLPMPHPKTPGFDSEVEQIWHGVLVELFNTDSDVQR